MVHYRRGDKAKYPSFEKYANVSNLIQKVRNVVQNYSAIVFATDESNPSNLKILDAEKVPRVSSLLEAASIFLHSFEHLIFLVQFFIWADKVVLISGASALDGMIEDGRRVVGKKVIWIT